MGRIPNDGWGWNNIKNTNVTSVAASMAFPTNLVLAPVAGTVGELRLNGDYYGIGSGRKNLRDYAIQIGIGVSGNFVNTKLSGLAGRYMNAGTFLNNFGVGTLVGLPTNTLQTIVDESKKNENQ